MELCTRCGKSQKDFTSKKSYMQHFKNKDHNDESYSCKKCDHIFPKMRSLQVHFSAVHDSTVTFECETCKKSFSRKQALIRHQLTQEEFGVSCFKCRKSFSSYNEQNFNRHFNNCRGRIFENTQAQFNCLFVQSVMNKQIILS